MTDENTLAETMPIELAQTQEPQSCCETPVPKMRPNPNRTIFRFKGTDDWALDLGKIYKIVLKEKEKRVVLQMSPRPEDLNDAIDFDTEEAAHRGYEQIIGAWAANVLE